MHIGALIFPTDLSIRPARLARELEDRGFESMWVTEHTHIPTSRRTPWPGGPVLPEEYRRTLDPYVALTAAATVTERLKLGTGISLVAQHDPILLAKTVASVDLVSDGRMVLGIGVGWNEDEMEHHGVDPKRRRAVAREKVLAMLRLWTEEEASYEGEFVRFRECTMSPRPAAGRVPVHIGGHTEVAARRAGRLGDGFFPGTTDAEHLARILGVMRQAAEEAGRDPDAIEVTTGGPLDADGIRRLGDLGVHRVTIPPLAFDVDGLRRGLGAFAEDVMAKVG